MAPKSFQSIALELKKSCIIELYELGVLRDAAGYGKLGGRMIKEVEEGLRKAGVKHLPRDLPHDDQERKVMLYAAGTLIDELIETAREPSNWKTRRVFNQAAQALADAEKLRKVRDLLCPEA